MALNVSASCALCASPSPPPRTGPDSGAVSATLAAILIFTIVTDVMGNVLVILSVYRNKKLRNAGNIFVVSLSVADLIVALYPYPLALLAIFHGGWTLDAVQCQLSGFILGLGVIGSVFNITAIAINRYCYICHTVHYERYYTRRNTCLCLGLTWVLSAIATLPNFLLGSLTYDHRVFSCTFTQTVSSSYTASVVLVHFLIPLTIVSFCYLRIWMLVIRVKGRVRPRPWARAADLRHFLTMFVVFVLFAVCWAPLNFIGLAVALDPVNMAPKVPEWLYVASYFLAYFNSCLNAVVYGLLNQNFRREYHQILLSLCAPRALLSYNSRGKLRSKQSPAVTNNILVEAHL
ncbi:LOW QUALITY PROTEIN: melatonin receptor type 1C [Hemibagrus wyckioides]|uniref:LOW QUALITY PROTEIN: melatonin receptor type 1C n=1 Tax=Hemibagrus wyckioides TaxID=337641 RepID=UPI00266D81DD|nr:LOW QUALITY PROTEIN: melatonin receptor type 1C [Hemibagrus wyckioides]